MPSTSSPSPVATSPGTVTFLFTDIEGSTRLLQSLGDAWGALLEAHAALLRSSVARHGGRIVDTAGDGAFAVFETARGALAAAVEAQRAIAQHEWPGGARVRVRMGLHTGEPLVGPTGYLGLDVHRAARIAAAAHGGQVLVSESTLHLVAGELPDGVTVRGLGEHRLKDLPSPEALHQAVIESLPSEFPPPRGVTEENRLPQPATPLLGRESELERLLRLIRDPAVRLVTLTGPGGTGKTRLALEAAHRLRPEYAGRAHFVALVGVRDPGGVLPAIGRSLEVPQMAGQSVVDALADWVANRPTLLVLDNFEQVVDAAPALAELLSAAPALRALITSRAPLNLRAERELPVATLATPAGTVAGVDALRAYPAVELFLERAAGARPALDRDPDALAAVAEICRRLDGLPLAIELAAARVRLFPPRVLLSKLDRRLELLSGGPRDLPERHRTLREAIGWSHDLLRPDERVLFRRLSVFPGGFTFEMAEVVATAAPGAAPALEGLESLLERSLIVRADGDEDVRFAMLETIREYALEQLEASGESPAILAAAAAHLLGLAETAEPALTGPSPTRWLELLDRENDNLRAACDWLGTGGDLEGALRLGAALWRYWVIRGRHAEGLDRLRVLVHAAGARPIDGLLVRVLTGLATMAYEHGHMREARTHLEAVLEHCRAQGDAQNLTTTLNHLGWVASFDSDPAIGWSISEEALALSESRGDARGAALALNNLGWIATMQGDCRRALPLLERSLSLRRTVGDPRGIAYALLNLHRVRLRQGAVEEAIAGFDEAIAVLDALGDRQIMPFGLHLKGWGLHWRGDGVAAVALLRDAVLAAREIGHATILGFSLCRLAGALLDAGDPETARMAYEEAIVTHDRGQLRWGALSSRAGLAECLARMRKTEEANALLSLAFPASAALSMRFELAECLEAAAELAILSGDGRSAAYRLGAAAAIREEAGAPVPRICTPSIEARTAAARTLAGDGFMAAVESGRRATAEDRATLLAGR